MSKVESSPRRRRRRTKPSESRARYSDFSDTGQNITPRCQLLVFVVRECVPCTSIDGIVRRTGLPADPPGRKTQCPHRRRQDAGFARSCEGSPRAQSASESDRGSELQLHRCARWYPEGRAPLSELEPGIRPISRPFGAPEFERQRAGPCSFGKWRLRRRTILQDFARRGCIGCGRLIRWQVRANGSNTRQAISGPIPT
jgi:hypothetical protein